MSARSANAMAISPTNSCGSIRLRHAREHLATTRDAVYGWTAERLVTKQAEAGVPGYLYLFDHGYPAADDAACMPFTPANCLMCSATSTARRRIGPRIRTRRKSAGSPTR